MIQCQFINKLLKTKDSSILVLNNLNEEFFSDYSEEYKFISNHLSKYGNIPDIETFLNKFPDFDVLEVNENINYLVDELYTDRNKRKLAKVFNKVRELINADKIDEAMSVYTNASSEIVSAKHIDSVDIFKDLSRYDDYVKRCEDFSRYYIKTGFEELDKLIGGWDKEEELATIVARPGVGKSWVMLKCAVAAAKQGLNVGIYSGEMSDRKVGYRIDTLLSHVSNRGMMQGNISVQVDYKRFLDNISKELKGSIRVLTPTMIQGPAGVNALRAFIEKDKLDMLCIDQHSLLEDDRKAKNPVERASNISKDLKNLQVLTHIPIIAVSQQNRTSLEDGHDLTQVAQSDRIAQDSTVVLFIERQDSTLTLYLVKCRDSVNGKQLQYAIDLDKGVFSYIPCGDDALQGESCKELQAEFEEGEDTGEDVY